MLTNGHPEPVRPDHSTDDDSAARPDSRDSPVRGDDTPRSAGDSTLAHGDTPRVAAGRQRHLLPSASESNYSAQATADAADPGGGLRIELPPDGPLITPGAARALLRVILAAARQVTPEPSQPPRRTP